MNAPRAERLLALALARGALTYGDFVLSSGKRSGYYFDGRLLTLDPEGAYEAGGCFLRLAREARADAIAGPTIGADPIVAAVALMSHLDKGTPVVGLIVRKEPKAHGGRRAIEGPLPQRIGARVMVVDDTCTSGASLLHAVRSVEAEGCTVARVACILDRREGGGDEVRRLGYDFVALLVADEAGRVRVA